MHSGIPTIYTVDSNNKTRSRVLHVLKLHEVTEYQFITIGSVIAYSKPDYSELNDWSWMS